MKDFFEKLVAIIIVSLFFWLVISFINLEFNIFLWGWGSRTWFLILEIWSLYAIALRK